MRRFMTLDPSGGQRANTFSSSFSSLSADYGVSARVFSPSSFLTEDALLNCILLQNAPFV